MIKEYIKQVEKFSSLKPKTILEIGALDGHYAKVLKTHFRLSEGSTYLVEPNPDLYLKLKTRYPKAHTFNRALSDKSVDRLLFNKVVSGRKSEVGCSSLMERSTGSWNDYILKKQVKISVQAITGYSLLKRINKPIDLCILDVEGMSYQVLSSFGSKISLLRSVMVECEHTEIFTNQKLFQDVSDFLFRKKYRMMAFKYSYANQSDSIWIQEKYIKFN